MTSNVVTSGLQNRSTVQIYRDCMRLIAHLCGDTVKAIKVRDMVRKQFKQNKHLTDEKHIDQLRNAAMQGLTNYLTITSLQQNNIQVPKQINNKNTNKHNNNT